MEQSQYFTLLPYVEKAKAELAIDILCEPDQIKKTHLQGAYEIIKDILEQVKECDIESAINDQHDNGAYN